MYCLGFTEKLQPVVSHDLEYVINQLHGVIEAIMGDPAIPLLQQVSLHSCRDFLALPMVYGYLPQVNFPT